MLHWNLHVLVFVASVLAIYATPCVIVIVQVVVLLLLLLDKLPLPVPVSPNKTPSMAKVYLPSLIPKVSSWAVSGTSVYVLPSLLSVPPFTISRYLVLNVPFTIISLLFLYTRSICCPSAKSETFSARIYVTFPLCPQTQSPEEKS